MTEEVASQDACSIQTLRGNPLFLSAALQYRNARFSLRVSDGERGGYSLAVRVRRSIFEASVEPHIEDGERGRNWRDQRVSSFAGS